MKYLFLILFSTSLYASDSAQIEIEYHDSTRAKQIITLTKNKENIICTVANQPPRKLVLSKIKGLQFPLIDIKSVNSCDKVITWNYKNKPQKSCYFPKQDTVINDILFDCYN